MRTFFERVDAVLVHSAEQARIAHDLGARRVSVADLPPHLPGGAPVERPDHDGPTRLLALGIVREYKGVDLLMRALAQVPGPTLTVAGEMWGEAGAAVKALAQDPRLRGRVQVHGGYVPADRLAPMLASHDVLALTYRSATASQNALLGQRHGLPVLASEVGTFGVQVRDGVDGLLVPPDDEEALVAALRRLADPAYAAKLRSAVRPPDLSGSWATYVGTLEALASPESGAEEPEPLVMEAVEPAGPAPHRLGRLRSPGQRVHRLPPPGPDPALGRPARVDPSLRRPGRRRGRRRGQGLRARPRPAALRRRHRRLGRAGRAGGDPARARRRPAQRRHRRRVREPLTAVEVGAGHRVRPRGARPHGRPVLGGGARRRHRVARRHRPPVPRRLRRRRRRRGAQPGLVGAAVRRPALPDPAARPLQRRGRRRAGRRARRPGPGPRPRLRPGRRPRRRR